MAFRRAGNDFVTVATDLAQAPTVPPSDELPPCGLVVADGLCEALEQGRAHAGVAGLEFYTGVPGSIGGALVMNAGCYGHNAADDAAFALERAVLTVARARRG